MGPRCFKCLMFSPSGPVELVFLVDLRAAEVCAIVIGYCHLCHCHLCVPYIDNGGRKCGNGGFVSC